MVIRMQPRRSARVWHLKLALWIPMSLATGAALVAIAGAF